MSAAKSSQQQPATVDRALFGDEIPGAVAACYANERPLRGLAGLLDWRFGGMISDYLRKGAVTGSVGECAYLPVQRLGKTYHVILVGCGHALAPGQRDGIPAESLDKLKQNLARLGVGPIGLSAADFGEPGKDFFNKTFKGASVCVLE